MLKRTCHIFTLLICLLFASPTYAAEPPLAFPEADGYGRFAKGGRGGIVYVITSLEDNPQNPAPGTLRHAVEQNTPRTIVFAVSGLITLKDDLRIRHNNITIAGQTSPNGICLRGATTFIDADEVIIRYLRFRLGVVEKDADAAWGRHHKNIIMDHCSFSWSVDETASFYNNQNFTIQYCLIAESLNNSGHEKGAHGYGGIWGGAGASFHHNVLAHHRSRNPRINGHRLSPKYPQDQELTDIRNNVIYNWSSNTVYGGERGQFNLANNYFKTGPANGPERLFQFYGDPEKDNYGRGFISGNVFANNDKLTQDNALGVQVRLGRDASQADQQKAKNKVIIPNPFTPKTLANFPSNIAQLVNHTAQEAYQLLIHQKEVGANRNANGRFQDDVDTRILHEVQTGTATHKNGIIDRETDVINSWETYISTFPKHPVLQDDDLDGLPDMWEKEKDVSNPNAYDLSKTYTNIEVYFNRLGHFDPSLK